MADVHAGTAAPLLRSCHPAPTVAVTILAGLLAVGVGADKETVGLLVLAVLTGQLSIGWSNDLVDAGRDRQVGRADKPLANAELSERSIGAAVALALAACIVLSLLCGLRAGAVHVFLVVGSGLAYNLGLKATAWSWLPYAVAFGSLPAVVTLALDPPAVPPAWMVAAGALLGVGAHLVNVLPDLDDDASTGVRGLPHRIGRRATQLAATVVLSLASVVVVVAPAGSTPAWAWAGLAPVIVLALLSVRGGGRTPFHAAIAIAVIDVVMLVGRV